MAGRKERGDSSSELLQELETLSQSLYQSQSNRRRANSLVLPRSADSITAPVNSPRITEGTARSDRHSRSSRLISISPWRSRPKPRTETEPNDGIDADERHHHPPSKSKHPSRPPDGERKGIWNWKPLRVLSHIGMQRLGCLFSIEVIAVHGLPASLNGLRLSVSVRKKEAKDGAVQTMPSRVLQGSAAFDETLFIKCHLYSSGGVGTGKPLKFEPRPFIISTLAIDALELDFGRNMVDLSLLVLDSIEKSLEGVRVRQWDTSLKLSGKAKGGELALRLGFQIMEDGGIGIYSQAESVRSNKEMDSSYSIARKQSKSSFSVMNPRVTRSHPSKTPQKGSSSGSAKDLKSIDESELDESGPPISVHKSEPESKTQDLDLPEFEVIDMGIQIQGDGGRVEEDEAKSEDATEATSVSSEVVKEVMHDRDRQVSLKELDSISRQIKALELIMTGDEINPLKMPQGQKMQQLDAEEETVTKEFLQMLEFEDDDDDHKYVKPEYVTSPKSEAAQDTGDEAKVLLSDLGKSLGPVVQTKDGGYLASMNPFNVVVERKEIPKLVMQISRPYILQYLNLASGFEVFQTLASMDLEDLSCKIFSLTAMDELMGKSAEQIAFEGIASAIISGRNKEGASSSAAKSIAIVKKIATAMSEGRKERISAGIWFAKEDPVSMEEILAFSLQKMEAMSVEALKIQADMAEEQAPFEFTPHLGKDDPNHDNLLDSTISPENWAKKCSSDTTMTMLVIIQLRDPLRSLEAVGAPMMVVVQAAIVEKGEDEGCRFKVTSLHLGALKLRSGRMRSVWGGEKQRLTAKQWLVANGLGTSGRKTKPVQAKGTQDLLCSLSSRVVADMWLKPMRNPDVKIKSDNK